MTDAERIAELESACEDLNDQWAQALAELERAELRIEFLEQGLERLLTAEELIQ
jgi:chromosome segregation ATPase